jgi:cyclic pyranopterin phosphate synthase
MFDRFRRKIDYLRISVTDLCDLRCVYCMPAEGVPLKRHDEILTFEEIEEVVREAVKLGVTKIRFTGGEPLVRRGILELVARVGAIDGIHDFALTTNGTRLSSCARELRQAGICRVNISLDSLDPERYATITRGGRLDQVLAGVNAAIAAGFSRIKLNCVVEASAAEPDAQAVADYARRMGLEVRFIRRMDTRKGEFWRVVGGDGGHCSACNRLRITSDGRVFPCLFDDTCFHVRALGARAALEAAVLGKPAAGTHSHNNFYALGG